jgi:TolA-binding protein
MTSGRGGLEDGVRDFQRATARSADGRATRARVLAAAERQARVRRGGWRAARGAAVGLAVVLSGAVAWTAIAAIGRWRASADAESAAATAVPAAHPRGASHETLVEAPSLVTPVAGPSSARATADARSDEERAYGRAHEAHFGGAAPAVALAAWDAYLRRYPGGAMEPEARYNRALTLLRLGRVAPALEALRPFADGSFGAYRRAEAAALIDATATRASGIGN